MKADAAGAAAANQTNASTLTDAAGKAPSSPDLAQSLQSAASSANSNATQSGAEVSQAHLFGGPGGTELRIQLNTEELGPIELRATSDKDRIGAVISAAKPETQELLSSELPTLHQALSERNLQVQQLTINNGGALTGGMSGRGSYSQNPEAWQRQVTANNYWQTATDTPLQVEEVPSVAIAPSVPGKLSVHA